MTIEVEAAAATAAQRSDPVGGGWDGYAGAIIGARELKAALRRRRRVWVGTAVAGLLLGASLHVLLPRTYKAVANAYLNEPPGSAPSVEMANEVSLLQTKAVEQRAAGYLFGHPSGPNLPGSYKGTSLSLSILSISATGKSPSAAVALDNAVAKAFVAVRSDELTRESDVVVKDLQAQIADLQRDPTSNADQILNLTAQVTQVRLELKSSVDGSFVLDPGEAVKASTKKAAVEDSLGGLVGGLGLGGGIVAIGEILSDRPRRRDDVAAALEVGVELSVARTRSRPSARRRPRVGAPSKTTAVLQRRLRAHLDTAPHRSLAVFGVGTERAAALAVVALASTLVSDGASLLLVDAAEGRPLARMFGLKPHAAPVQCVDLQGRMLTLVVTPDDPALDVGPIEGTPASTVVVLASADPAFGVDHIATWARDGVVIVRAGAATNVQLHGTGRMIRRAGICLRSAILVGADPRDDSVGFLETTASRVPHGHQVEVGLR